MSHSKDVLEYLRENKKLFNVSELERRAFIPSGCLRKAINGQQQLSEAHYGILLRYVHVTLVRELSSLTLESNS